MRNKALLVVGAGLAVVSLKFAGVAAATPQPTGDTFHGPSSTVSIASIIPNAGPAAMDAPAMGSDAASADAKGSLGNSSPVSSLCEQNAAGSAVSDGATVNSSGTDSAYSRAATDGNVLASVAAVPQYKAQQMPIAVA